MFTFLILATREGFQPKRSWPEVQNEIYSRARLRSVTCNNKNLKVTRKQDRMTRMLFYIIKIVLGSLEPSKVACSLMTNFLSQLRKNNTFSIHRRSPIEISETRSNSKMLCKRFLTYLKLNSSPSPSCKSCSIVRSVISSKV